MFGRIYTNLKVLIGLVWIKRWTKDELFFFIDVKKGQFIVKLPETISDLSHFEGVYTNC